ncbi:unnamed protein product [Malassezia sympodialis ATCC 42132]|uniref:Similar to S.cerevisiae protein NIT3 (Nit protein) n=1 Tax=Malassezia sympodialis (strain ATCC 42132) TaxID=1230383 RepID=M5E946_MALS4|nr:uncharacterized protein MSY001_1670 [Malassezia sympodialis ATCC 42132]CCU98964.1 unnamed protein product [Malassezia sympodialis ATCC 42132]SHO79730.1 Similar to S.cerevisiae protein NIT3 (Nit protein) [Malassezia sympodialis ATCC 42132]|eukprot:XP_018740235.1 uncharacterized protein MSY001_1670 [Malassezia sympodialis ATCC 42132]
MPSTPLPFHLQTTRMALVQLGQIGADKAFNLQHARSSVLRAVKEAPQGGVDLVMLPECFNSPYSVDKFRQYAESFSGLYEQVKRGGTDVAKNGGQRAWPIDNLDNARAVTLSQACLESSPSLRMLSMLAQEAGVVLVGGSVPEIDPDTDRIYNTSCVFDNEGRVLSLHRKLHLFDIDIPGKMTFQESKTLSGGDRVTIFDCAHGRFGLGICYDMRFPESAQIAARLGAGALLYPGAFNTTTGPLAWELLLRARAVDNQVYTVGCSPARPPEGYPAWGHSTVVDPLAVVVETCDEKEAVVYATLMPERVAEVRRIVPISMQRRFDVYPNVAH